MPEVEEDMDANNIQDDTTDLQQQLKKLRKEQNMSAFIGLMTAFLTNEHDYSMEACHEIWDGVRKLEALMARNLVIYLR